MYIDTTINDYNAAMWLAFYGEETYEQNSFAFLFAADVVQYNAWLDATVSTLYPSQVAHYYDCKLDMPNQPEYHHFPCQEALNPDESVYCEYCHAIICGLEDDYEQTVFVTYDVFNTRFPGKYDEDGYFKRGYLPYRFNYSDLFTTAEWYVKEEPEEEDESYDEYEDEYEDDEYDTGVGNYYSYNNGNIVDPDHFSEVDNGWLAPNGTFYYVTDYNRHGTAHWECARLLGFDGSDPVHSAEQAGYIHISRYYSATYRFHFIPDRPTKAQKEVAAMYASAMGIPLPESLEYDDPCALDDESHEVKTYVRWTRIEESTLPRNIRDQFYPLSGD